MVYCIPPLNLASVFRQGGGKMFQKLLFLGIAIYGFSAQAAQLPWEIGEVTVRQVSEQSLVAPDPSSADCGNFVTPKDFGIGPSEIITIGEKLWDIVIAGKPKVNVVTPTVAALPAGTTCWADLAGWHPPKSQIYSVSYKNLMGIEVVHMNFRLQFAYGGSKNGTGKYLSGVTMLPADLSVIWGYDFNASVAADQAINMGTTADPIAGIGLTLKWAIKTPIDETDNSINFFVQGDGQVIKND
jgi:hypothetical protein